MIKQAQELQQKMADAQQKVETLEAEGVAGGGIVKVTINGKNIVTSINIDDSVIDKNEKEILEDLIMAAFNDAKEKSRGIWSGKFERPHNWRKKNKTKKNKIQISLPPFVIIR